MTLPEKTTSPLRERAAEALSKADGRWFGDHPMGYHYEVVDVILEAIGLDDLDAAREALLAALTPDTREER